MNRLRTRKRLLLVESDLNREMLASDSEHIVSCFSSLRDQGRTLRVAASGAVKLLVGLSGFAEERHEPSVSSRAHALLKCAQVIDTLCYEFGSSRKQRPEKTGGG